MKCVLHIGAEKTGSTSLQVCLFNNRHSLLSESRLFVAVNPRNANLTWLAKAARRTLTNDTESTGGRGPTTRDLATSVNELQSELFQARQYAERCVISTEHFHSKLKSKESVAQLKAFLDPAVDSYQIVCYLRRQDELVISRHSTALRAGLADRPLLPPLRRNINGHLLDFEGLLDRWSSVFGEETIQPRVYHPDHLVGGDVRDDFFALLNVTIPMASSEQPSNTSLSSEAQLALAAFNRVFQEQPGQQSRLQKDFVAHLERHHGGTGLLPSRQQALEFTERFAESNTRVARRWFGRDQLFNDDYSRYGEAPTAADRKQSAAILGDFLIDAEPHPTRRRDNNP